MEVAGRMCTLYPLSWQGAVMPTTFVVPPVEHSFDTSFVAALKGEGYRPRLPVAGSADLDLVIRAQVVRADPGNRGLRWMLPLVAGAAVFEVEIQIAAGTGPVATVHVQGKRRWGFYGGDSQVLLQDSAKLAGKHAVRRIAELALAH